MTSKAPKTGADPFAAVCVHGLWPLVADEEAPGGLRFADLRTDKPDVCVRAPDQLPDADISIHTFVGIDVRDAWIAAAREFGGNGVALAQAPLNHAGGIQAVLAVRFDRGRRPGATLDEAVTLRRDAEVMPGGRHRQTPTAIGTSWRAHYLDRIASDRELGVWKERWKAEIEAIGADPRFNYSTSPDKSFLPLEIDQPFGLRGRVTKEPDGVRFVLDAQGMDRLADRAYAQAWRIAVEARGWEVADADAPSVRLAALGTEDLARLAADIDVLGPCIKRLTRLSGSHTAVLAHLADPETVRVLRRLHAGLPIASSLYREPAAQVSPKTGEPMQVAGSRVERLFEGGIIEPVWWRDRYAARPNRALPVPTLHDMQPIVWGLTATGAALVEERFEDAAETQAEDAATAGAWICGRRSPDARLPVPHEGPEVIADRFRVRDARLAEAVSKLGARFRPGSDIPMWPKTLAQAATALAARQLDLDGTKLVPRSASAAAPRSGG